MASYEHKVGPLDLFEGLQEGLLLPIQLFGLDADQRKVKTLALELPGRLSHYVGVPLSH